MLWYMDVSCTGQHMHLQAAKGGMMERLIFSLSYVHCVPSSLTTVIALCPLQWHLAVLWILWHLVLYQ